jgi:hypothetical protein
MAVGSADAPMLNVEVLSGGSLNRSEGKYRANWNFAQHLKVSKLKAGLPAAPLRRI